MEKPDAILFDFGETLCTQERFDTMAGNRRCLELAVNNHGLTAEDIQREADRITGILKPLRESSSLEFRVDTFQNLLYDGLGLRFVVTGTELEEEFWKAAVRFSPISGAHETLELLRSEDIALGVISNFGFSGKILREELARQQLLSFFDVVIASSEYAIRKPNPLLFELAAKMLKKNPKDIWFVGDTLEYDVAGARSAGMTSVWFNQHGATPDGIAPDITFTRWSGFPKWTDPPSRAQPV